MLLECSIYIEVVVCCLLSIPSCWYHPCGIQLSWFDFLGIHIYKYKFIYFSGSESYDPPKLRQATQNSSDQPPPATTEGILNWVEKAIRMQLVEFAEEPARKI